MQIFLDVDVFNFMNRQAEDKLLNYSRGNVMACQVIPVVEWSPGILGTVLVGRPPIQTPHHIHPGRMAVPFFSPSPTLAAQHEVEHT